MCYEIQYGTMSFFMGCSVKSACMCAGTRLYTIDLST